MAHLGATPHRIQRVVVIAVGAAVGVGLVAGGALLLLRGGSAPPSVADICAADPGGWNGAAGGPLHRGLAPGAAQDPIGPWQVAWTHHGVTAPPSAASGTVYTVSAQGSLLALDGRTGAVRWHSDATASEIGPGHVPVAVDGCSAVVGTSSVAASGNHAGAVRAVDLGSHRRRWGVPTGDEVLSGPEITRGVVFAGVGLSRPGAGLNLDYLVEGFNLAEPSAPFRQRFRAAVIASPASDGATLYAGCFDQNLYAFALEVGSQGNRLRQLWSFATGGIITAAPVLGDGVVYLASDDHLVYAVDARTGAERWHADVGGPVDAAPVLAGREVVAVTRDGRVAALDAVGGRMLWSAQAASRVNSASGGLAAIGDRVALVDASGRVALLSLQDGSLHASFATGVAPIGAPAIAGGFLYLTTGDGDLVALPV